MGCAFWILHVVAFLVFFPALFITIPLHIIAAQGENKKK